MRPLLDPLLAGCAPRHGFGVRGWAGPRRLARPRQVHGAVVVDAERCQSGELAPAADAVVTGSPGVAVGVVTADCVPLLLSAPGGRAVAAVHAGWRGLAAGVVEAAVAALAELSCAGSGELVAAIGPHIGPCCYEVDGPVLEALAARFAASLGAASRPARPGHEWLDLGALAQAALLAAGVGRDRLGLAAAHCTRCDAQRFHSFRRDGPSAGRLIHFVAARAREA